MEKRQILQEAASNYWKLISFGLFLDYPHFKIHFVVVHRKNILGNSRSSLIIMTFGLNGNYTSTTNSNQQFGKMWEKNWEEETRMTISFNTKSMVKLKKQT